MIYNVPIFGIFFLFFFNSVRDMCLKLLQEREINASIRFFFFVSSSRARGTVRLTETTRVTFKRVPQMPTTVCTLLYCGKRNVD